MVIADTSVLQYLHQIDRLHLLTDLYAAKHLGIACTGLLGVLLYAKEEGRLDEVETTIELLKGCGFRLSEELRREALRLAGEV